MKKLLILIIFVSISATCFAEDQLVFVSMITRHGDRTPFSNIENAEYKWKTGLGELTPEGMNQEYNSGVKLRKRYIDELKLLQPQYVDESIYTVSSDTSRTILSAESLLFGLYPPGSGPKLDNGKPALPGLIQPIPVRSVSANSPLIMVPYPQYLKILEKYIYPSKVWKDKENEYKLEFAKWTKILGNKITCLADILSIGDVLIVAQHHNLPLPNGLSERDAMEIIKLTSWGLVTQFESEIVSYLCSADLLNAIAKNMSDAINQKAPYKMTYYSGHDITILPVMGLLGAPIDKSPGYAARLQLELYKNNINSYKLKVRYNGKPVKLPIMKNSDNCSIESFMQLVNELNNKYKDLTL